MKFYHQGAKKSNEQGVTSGCLMLIGFGAFIFFLSLLKDVEDVKEYLLEIIIFCVVIISFGISIFRQKGQLSNKHLTLKNNHLIMDKVSVPIEHLLLDIYKKGENFGVFHLRDKNGKIAIYSVVKDDFLVFFKNKYPEQTTEISTHSVKHQGPLVSVNAENRSLHYDLATGKYTLSLDGQSTIVHIPDVYTYDGKYKQAKSLLKRR